MTTNTNLQNKLTTLIKQLSKRDRVDFSGELLLKDILWNNANIL